MLSDDVPDDDGDGASDTDTADEALILEEALGNGLRETVAAPEFESADGEALRDAKDTVSSALNETLGLFESNALALAENDALPLLWADADGRAL